MAQTTEKTNYKFRMMTQLCDQKCLVDTFCTTAKSAEAAFSRKNK